MTYSQGHQKLCERIKHNRTDASLIMHGLKDLGETVSDGKKRVRVLVETENESMFPLDILGWVRVQKPTGQKPTGRT